MAGRDVVGNTVVGAPRSMAVARIPGPLGSMAVEWFGLPEDLVITAGRAPAAVRRDVTTALATAPLGWGVRRRDVGN
jgi:hypothetical protein